MEYQAIRKLQKNGNSYTVAIPRPFLFQLALFRGEEMRVVYNDETETITIKRLNPRPALSVVQGRARGVRAVL